MPFYALLKTSYDTENFMFGNLGAQINSGDTTADLGSANFTPGKYVILYSSTYTAGSRAYEVLQIGSLVSGTTYNVTRDVLNAYTTNPYWNGAQYFLVSDTPSGRPNRVLDSVDVTSSIKFSTQLPGGFGACSFALPTMPNDVHTRLFTHLNADVTIFDHNGNVVWNGYVSDVSVGDDKTSVMITADGYYTKASDVFFDMIYYSPEATTNKVPNPSFENNISDGGWATYTAATGAMAYRSTSYHKYGSACLALQQPGLDVTTDFVYALTLTGLTNGGLYTLSFWAMTDGLLSAPYIQVSDTATKPNMIIESTQIVGLTATEWRRYIYQVQLPAGVTSVRIYFCLSKRTTEAKKMALLVDGVQFEEKGYDTPYCDGSLGATYSWSGTAHNSASSRAGVPVYQSAILSDVVDFVDAFNKFKLYISTGDYDVGNCDFIDKKARAALDYVSGFGRNISGEAVQTHLAMWENRVLYLITEPRLENAVPNWVITTNDLSGNRMSVSANLQEVYNKVYSVYSNNVDGPTKTIPAEDAESQARYGVREGFLQNGDFPFQMTQAYDFQNAALERYKYPRPVRTFEVLGRVSRIDGSTAPVYDIRAGDVVLIGDIGTTASSVGSMAGISATKAVCFVLRTEYDASTDILRFDVGTGDVSFEILMGRLGISGGLT
jgi:hypothetical protein